MLQQSFEITIWKILNENRQLVHHIFHIQYFIHPAIDYTKYNIPEVLLS